MTVFLRILTLNTEWLTDTSFQNSKKKNLSLKEFDEKKKKKSHRQKK